MKEELKTAFRKTIARWKRIVYDTGYYDRWSGCDLCKHVGYKHGTRMWNCEACPIGQKTKGVLGTGCGDTPWRDFIRDRTKENALKELVFLEELYIELLEGEAGVVPGYPEKQVKPHIDRHYAEGCLCDTCVSLATKRTIELASMQEKQATKPKEEWVDITEEVKWKYSMQAEGYWLMGTYKNEERFYLNGSEVLFNQWNNEDFRIAVNQGKKQVYNNNFRILKRKIK